MLLIEKIREELSIFTQTCSKDVRIIDSFPLPVCKFRRARFHKLFKGCEANYGYCASKKETYLGYKVHALSTEEGYISDFVINSASVDDRTVV